MTLALALPALVVWVTWALALASAAVWVLASAKALVLVAWER